ncbi:hypothetical protein [Streptosporangium roseum]|uniref:hypothetical protein n=1 Tax=Streptosporangium roseum TaxID=2001 RepID=UPI00332C91BC
MLDEARSIGRIVGESISEGSYKNTTDVINALVIDTGGKSGPESVNKAMDILGKRGWKTSFNNLPISATLESPKWEANELIVRPFSAMYMENEPEILEAINRTAAKPDALVIVWAWMDGSRA